MNSKKIQMPTDERVGRHIRQIVESIAPAVVVTYVLGEAFGQAVHKLNDWLAGHYVRLLGLSGREEVADARSGAVDRLTLQRHAWAQQGRQYGRMVQQRRRWARGQTVATLRRLARKHGMTRDWCRVARKAQLVHHYGHVFAVA